VVVVAVDEGTPAARKGIKPGDIITSINQQAVTNPQQFRAALKSADLKKGVAVKLLRGGAARVEVLKETGEK
jgi:serine protease Do